MTPQVTYWIICTHEEIGPLSTRVYAETALVACEQGCPFGPHLIVEKVRL